MECFEDDEGYRYCKEKKGVAYFQGETELCCEEEVDGNFYKAYTLPGGTVSCCPTAQKIGDYEIEIDGEKIDWVGSVPDTVLGGGICTGGDIGLPAFDSDGWQCCDFDKHVCAIENRSGETMCCPKGQHPYEPYMSPLVGYEGGNIEVKNEPVCCTDALVKIPGTSIYHCCPEGHQAFLEDSTVSLPDKTFGDETQVTKASCCYGEIYKDVRGSTKCCYGDKSWFSSDYETIDPSNAEIVVGVKNEFLSYACCPIGDGVNKDDIQAYVRNKTGGGKEIVCCSGPVVEIQGANASKQYGCKSGCSSTVIDLDGANY